MTEPTSSAATVDGTPTTNTITGWPKVAGRCPACRGSSLFLGSGGHVTCSRSDCPNPVAADDLLHPAPIDALSSAAPIDAGVVS